MYKIFNIAIYNPLFYNPYVGNSPIIPYVLHNKNNM